MKSPVSVLCSIALSTFAANVKKHAGSCFHQLRQLRAVRRTLPVDAAKTLVHALITTRVDAYCNNALYGITTTHQSASTSVSCQRGCSRLHHQQAQVRPHHWHPAQCRGFAARLQSVVVAKLLYASPAWWGVCLSSRTHILTTGTARLTNARTVRSRKGPGYLERKFHGTNGPGNECSRERMVLGTNIPDTVYMDYCLVIFFIIIFYFSILVLFSPCFFSTNVYSL